MSSGHLSRVLVVHNRDYEGADADPENRARADVLSTAEGVRAALERLGHPVDLLGIGGDLDGLTAAIAAAEPDVVFNLCESIDGVASLEPLLPMLLERAGLPYSGSPPLTLGLAVHKHRAKDVLRGAGVPTPEAALLTTPDVTGVALPFPLIVKPAREDASVGITLDSVVHDRAALERQVTFVLAHYSQPALVERYIEGREIYVSMLERPGGGVDILPLYEIDFAEMPAGAPRIVSFDGKWVESSPEFRGTRPVPCELAPVLAKQLESVATRAFAAMELRDYARLDVRLDAAGTPYVIDVNPNCDLSEGAGFARAAAAAGLGYDALIGRIVELAVQRRPHADTIPFTARSRAQRPDLPADAGVAAGGRAVRGGARSG
ncbi:MAG TPA: D-alanine--D-alanine ligase [Polyangia bacterium]|nr:D-alanine--D-alanine ligase [Polyangia bacterium]